MEWIAIGFILWMLFGGSKEQPKSNQNKDRLNRNDDDRRDRNRQDERTREDSARDYYNDRRR